MRRNTYMGLGVAIFALVVGGLIGWGLKSTMPINSSSPLVGIGGGPGGSSDSVQMTLNNLFVQHGVLTTLHLEEVYDGKDTTASSQQLKDNAQQIANNIGAKYGDKAKSTFLSMWSQHSTEYENYTRALKNNDANGMNTAKSNLAKISSDMGKFFNTLDSQLSPTQITNMMNDHIMLTLSIIDAYARKDTATMDKQIQAASEQAMQFAAYLSQAKNPTQQQSSY